jgi:phage shock protein A
MISLSGIVLGFLALVGLVVLINRGAFQNVVRAIRAQLGKAGSAAVAADPLAMYQQMIDEAKQSIGRARSGMANVKSLIARIQRQIQEGEEEEVKLNTRIRNLLEAGDETRAREQALNLAQVKKALEENRDQLRAHEDTFEAFAREVSLAQDKVNRAQVDARALNAKLEISSAQAELAEVTKACGFDVTSVSELEKHREEVLRRIDTNKAKAEITASTNKDELDFADMDREKAADDILAQFRTAPEGKQA